MTAVRVRRRVGLMLGAALSLPASSALHAQDVPVEPAAAVADAAQLDELLVELRMGRLVAETVFALTNGVEVLVPVVDFLTLAEIEHLSDAPRRIRAVLHPGRRSVTVDARLGSVTRDGVPLSLPDASLASDEGTVFVAVPVLEEAFGVTLRTDWTQLAVTVTNPQTLPVGRRLQREARWATLSPGQDPPEPGMRLDANRRAFGGAVLDWRLASTMNDLSGTTAYAVGAGGRVLDGALRLSARSLGPISQGEHRLDATYHRVFRGSNWLTQMRLGDGFTTGPRFRALRGLALTNAPHLRRSFFGVDSFAGRVGPGWDVELRQSNQTLDVRRADEQGAFAFDIPLRYGENAIQVVAFGPHGEVVTTDRLVLLGTDRLRRGAFEWGLSGGECRDSRCGATGNIDLRYGITDRWTARAGVESFVRDTLPSLAQPYVGLSGGLLPSLQLSTEAVHEGYVRGGLTFAPSPRLRARAAHTAFSSALATPVLHDARRNETTEADITVRPLDARSRWLVRASLVRQDFAFGVLSRVQGSSSFQAGRAHVELGIRREMDDMGMGFRWTRDFQFGAVTGMVTLPGRHNVWGRGELELRDGSEVDRVRGRMAYQVTPGTRLEVGAGWRRGFGSDLTVTFSADLAQLRSLTQMVAPEGFPTRVTQVTQGTVHWNEATGQVGFTPGPGLERGGISGYVFVDENGNGVRDPGEEGLQGVRVVIGGRASRSDAEGRHLAWDLIPFEPVRVWADSASIRDPILVPLRDEIEVVVPPSSFGRVDIPLTPSQELTGRVVRTSAGGDMPVPYAELELVHLSTGSVRRVRTFSDGEIYEIGVKPGVYELRADVRWLRSAGLEAVDRPQALEIQPGTGRAAPEPVVIRLRPAPDGGRYR